MSSARHLIDMSAGQDSSSRQKSKVCHVCGVATDTFHLNYGASVCLSCRAFFRRIVYKGKNKSEAFACKAAGNCVMSVKSRRRCQVSAK